MKPWLFVCLIGNTLTAWAQRTDLLYLRNGDVITGEIKKMEFGVLTYKTDDAGTLTVNWDKVMRLRSVHQFELVINDGGLAHGYGSLDTTRLDQQVVLVLKTGRVVLDLDKLTKIVPIKKGIAARLDGTLRLGLSYNKGSQVLNTNAGADANYRSLHDKVSVVANSTRTLQQFADTSELRVKQDLYFQYYRFFRNRMFVTGYNSLEENTELGLLLRAALGAGLGRELFLNKVNSLNFTLGVNGNRENSLEGSSTVNLEGLAFLQYRIYKLTIPKVMMYTYVYALPSISNPGRMRVTGNISVDFELFKDFTLGISSYQNYDNRPATAGSATFDWGITTNIGYTF